MLGANFGNLLLHCRRNLAVISVVPSSCASTKIRNTGSRNWEADSSASETVPGTISVVLCVAERNTCSVEVFHRVVILRLVLKLECG